MTAPAPTHAGRPAEPVAVPLRTGGVSTAPADLMRTRASSFSAAGRLLPPSVGDEVTRLYAVFRSLDDLVDDGDARAAPRLGAVEAWAAGRPAPATPEVVALRAVARRHPLPRVALTDFCAGMRHDLAGARCATERELDRYCYQVAGTVGLVLAGVLGVTDPEQAHASAITLGMAMQRTNILRDIDEDAARGRVYISDEARRRYGWSLAPGRRAALVRAQIARADELYDDGLLGVALLREGRAAVALAAGLYREILREIERTGLGRQGGRAVVPAPRKLRTTLRIVAAGR